MTEIKPSWSRGWILSQVLKIRIKNFMSEIFSGVLISQGDRERCLEVGELIVSTFGPENYLIFFSKFIFADNLEIMDPI